MNYAQLFATYEEQLVAIGEEAESLSFTFRGAKGLNFAGISPPAPSGSHTD